MNNEKTKLSFDLKKIKENENIEFKKADNDEIGTLMAMATPKPLLLDNFSMKDLDRETVSKFRKIVEERYPEKNYKNLNDEDFLKERTDKANENGYFPYKQ